MVQINWVGGEHEFTLRLGDLRALQKNCDAGPEQILLRVYSTDWRVDDLIETLRLGLIGGGMEPKEAGPLVTKLFEQHPKTLFKTPAMAILTDALFGSEDDPLPGEGKGVPPAPESGASASFTGTEQ